MNLSKPIFFLTSDQDWAPQWAIESFFEITSDIPVHMFRTNPCPVTNKAHIHGKITQGWHPNLLPESSHGTTQEEIIEYMIKHFPGCNTARCHTYLTNTHFDRLLYRSGIRADSQIATTYQENLSPINDISGIKRFPVFFEDDVFFHDNAPSLELSPVVKSLFSPGLKIFNIHPTFIACNTPSLKHYAEQKNEIFDSHTPSSKMVYKGKGSRTVFLKLKKHIEERGYKFKCFQKFVNRWIKANEKNVIKSLSP